MRSRNVPPDTTSYNAVLFACAKGGQWAKACELLEEMHTRDVQRDA
eukprot:gene2085-5615_t